MDNVWLEYRTSDGLIVNAIVYKGGEYAAPEGLALVERTNTDAWIGWVYDGENFIPPEPEPYDESAYAE